MYLDARKIRKNGYSSLLYIEEIFVIQNICSTNSEYLKNSSSQSQSESKFFLQDFGLI